MKIKKEASMLQWIGRGGLAFGLILLSLMIGGAYTMEECIPTIIFTLVCGYWSK